MIELAVKHAALPLRHPFTISRGTVAVQDTVIVQLREQGRHGYGEATTNPYYGATVESLTRRISAAAPLLRRHTTDDLDALLGDLAADLGDDMFARCALDIAAHDLWGKRQAAPVHRLWGLDPAAGPLSNYTIGIDT
ncbi:MAG: dipeptide epimerase, partial [Planctomycetaceae bacterium]